MKRTLMIAVAGWVLGVAGCRTIPETREARAVQSAEVAEAISAFKAKNPGIEVYFKESVGYAVLPKVFKAGFWVGGAGGTGEVYQADNQIGYCRLSQATLGFSFGGEFFREIIFFQNLRDLDRFRTGEFTFSAQASAVALEAGAGTKADYKDGMAVFVLSDKGLMVDASIGGQKFKYLDKQP
jgi:lipid-binding SYLF domain-containing protein